MLVNDRLLSPYWMVSAFGLSNVVPSALSLSVNFTIACKIYERHRFNPYHFICFHINFHIFSSCIVVLRSNIFQRSYLTCIIQNIRTGELEVHVIRITDSLINR